MGRCGAGDHRSPVSWASALPGAPGHLARLSDILGAEFRANAVEVRGGREGLAIEGFAALPTLTANYAGFVNGDNESSLDTPVSLATTASLAVSFAVRSWAFLSSTQRLPFSSVASVFWPDRRVWFQIARRTLSSALVAQLTT